MTLGFHDAKFRSVLAVEKDLHAAATYAANFKGCAVVFAPIEDVPNASIPTADVVIGGPPCQGFSQLGTRDPADPRNQLWQHYVDIVIAARPKVFVLENVPRFAASAEFQLLLEEVETGRLSDYQICYDVLNAADYGVAQRRKRAIVIGSRVGRPSLPPRTHSNDPELLAAGRRPWATVHDAIGRLKTDVTGTELPPRQHTFAETRVPGPFVGREIHFGRNPEAKSLERYDHVKPGGNRFDLPDRLLPPCWRKKRTGTADVMGRLRWEQPALTIRTEFFKPEKGRYLHPQYDDQCRVNRPLTHYEASRIQGFPRTFRWCGSKVSIARQIGNAVPPPLARAIADHVRSLLDAETATTAVAVDS